MSHLDGTAIETAFSMIVAISRAWPSSRTEQANSSWIWSSGVVPARYTSTIACFVMSAALAWINRFRLL